MSRLKQRPLMPTFMDLLNQQTTRMNGDTQTETDKPKEIIPVAVSEEIIPVADAAFCRQCGLWLSSDYISMGISFRCPDCNYSLFSINRIGAREKWEINKLKEE